MSRTGRGGGEEKGGRGGVGLTGSCRYGFGISRCLDYKKKSLYAIIVDFNVTTITILSARKIKMFEKTDSRV